MDEAAKYQLVARHLSAIVQSMAVDLAVARAELDIALQPAPATPEATDD